MFNEVYNDLEVLVTGHTGFKGSWLSIWLNELGAKVTGYAMSPPTEPNNFDLSNVGEKIRDVRGDVRDIKKLNETISKYGPKLIFHLAAQPIVLRSIHEPKETLDVNIGGTINVLECARKNNCVDGVVCITSDKCYENKESIWGYRETDSLGGKDPYSASKASAEIVIASYRETFSEAGSFPPIASARAGNVVGGGDFAEYRIVPDCMKALMKGVPIKIKNPTSVRPWQILFEPLSGYLWLGAKLLSEGKKFAEPWNFGPTEQKGVTTGEIAEELIRLWGNGDYIILKPETNSKETMMLRLDCTKAFSLLDWRAAYGWKDALKQTSDWFKVYASREEDKINMYSKCVGDIKEYSSRARELGIAWAL